MISKAFTLVDKGQRKRDSRAMGREIPVFFERFSGSTDLFTVQESRSPHEALARNAFLHGATVRNPDFSGFRNTDELRKNLETGTRDDSIIADAKRFADSAKVIEKEKLTDMNLNVCGGAVCVPAFLSGSPKNMWMLKRKRVPSRILHLAIDTSMNCRNSISDYKTVGVCLIRVIARLEKAGYRVRVTGVLSLYDYGTGNVLMMSMPLKRESEVMDYRRILYPLTDVSFFRGIGFDWIACNPNISPWSTGMGTETQTAFSDAYSDELLQEMYETALGKDAEYIAMRDMTDMLRRGRSKENIESYIVSRILNTEA